MPATTLIGRAVEVTRLEQLLVDVRTGHSAVLVLRGDRGIGKTALLDDAARQAKGYRIIRACGVESEMELPYAGLHLLCASLLDGLRRLPPPEREALEIAVGLSTGPQPDRFRVGVATLALLSSVATGQPLLCIIDDAQWLDRSSAQVLAFVVRRLKAQPIAILLAERESHRGGELDGLPELLLGVLSHGEARKLFASVIPGRVDESVVERIIAETGGNPSTLLSLLRGVSPTELAGGFGMTAAPQLPGGIQENLLERVHHLPSDSQRLLLVAAAEPVGDPTLLWRAAAELGIPMAAAERLESEGLLLVGSRVTFRQPLLRSVLYGVASKSERRCVHQALAAATDPASDPDRHAWHRGHAAEGPDEQVALELERCAAIAQDRGGFAAAAAFLEKAALLTLDPHRRTERALAAAAAKHETGAPDAAARLLVTAEIGPLDEARRGRLERLRAHIAFALRRGNDAPALLLRAARRLEPLELRLARETYLEALAAAVLAGRLSWGNGTAEIVKAAQACPPAPQPRCAIDFLLDGLSVRFAQGYAAAVGPLKLALAACGDVRAGDEATRWLWLASRIAADLWDDETWHAVTTVEVQLARNAGALAVLPYALISRAILDVHCGDFAAARALLNEADTITAAMGRPPLAHTSLMLAAWQGHEGRALELFQNARQDARARGEETTTTAGLATAVLYNGLGRYGQALAAAQDAGELDEPGLFGWTLVELIEAAVRTGDCDVAALAFQRLSERTRPSRTEWALGIEARSRALLSNGQAAEDLYQEAIERLGRSRIKVHLARAQLIYGEWLRRQGRRIDARVPLRAAQKFFATMGAGAFAERAHRELVATGEKIRRWSVDMCGQLTPQETRIAFLARDGLTNPEIGARLIVSPRTVEYHLHKVFAKLGITSRTQLHLVLQPMRPVMEGDLQRSRLDRKLVSACRCGSSPVAGWRPGLETGRG